MMLYDQYVCIKDMQNQPNGDSDLAYVCYRCFCVWDIPKYAYILRTALEGFGFYVGYNDVDILEKNEHLELRIDAEFIADITPALRRLRELYGLEDSNQREVSELRGYLVEFVVNTLRGRDRILDGEEERLRGLLFG